MYCLHIYSKKPPSASMMASIRPRKATQVLATMTLSMEAKFSLMEVIREALAVGTSVSMCPQVAPHKKVQRIKIRTAGRPAVLQDQVEAVVPEPLDGPVKDMAGGRACCHTQGRSSATVLIQGRTVLSMTSK